MLRIFRHFIPASTIILVAIEVTLMSAAIYSYFLLSADHGKWVYMIEPAFGSFSVVLSTLAVIGMLAVGLYNYDVFLDYRVMTIKMMLVFTLITPILFIFTLFVNDLFSISIDVWSFWYLKTVIVWLLCVLVTRAVFLNVADLDAFKKRIFVLGTGEREARIRQLVASHTNYYFNVSKFLAVQDRRKIVDIDRETEECSLSSIESLAELGARYRVSEIVVAADDRRGLPVHHLLHCKTQGISVVDYLTFWERENGKLDLDALQPSWLIYSDGFRTGWLFNAIKRTFDIGVSIIFLLASLPLLIVTAILIKFESPGPIFYCQERVGLNGRTFKVFKFRSMRMDAEKDGAQWAAERDPRVTRVGALIRKVRIDELPQIFNVLIGDVSFIGQRPERPVFVEQLKEKIPFYNERHSVKPGISGWAQINYPYGASLEDAREKLAYDLYYVKNRGLFLDLIVLIQTVRVILWPEGAR